MLNVQKKIYEFSQRLSYYIRGSYISFDFSTELKEFLNKNSIEFDTIKDEAIEIQYSDINFKIFENPKQYLIEQNVRHSNDILIINFKNSPISRINNVVYLDFRIVEDCFFFSNAESIIGFIDFLIEQDNESEESFHFIDYANKISRKIVLTSLSEKSRLILNYSKALPLMESENDYSEGLKKFEECFKEVNKDIPKFLKSSLIKFALRQPKKDRFELIFKNLPSIIDEAYMNFEIFINNLSIDEIRKGYDEYKTKFFGEISEILKKISQQIIGYPIIVASILFATYRLKENSIFLIILGIVILIATIYTVFLLKMNFKDLEFVRKLAGTDFNSIKKNGFFSEYPKEFDTLKEIKDHIDSRVKNLILVCKSYYWIITISNISLISLILYYLKVEWLCIVILAVSILIALALTNKQIWKKSGT